MEFTRRSFLRVAGASLLTLVAAPTASLMAYAEKKEGGVVLASKADAIKEIEKFENAKRVEQYLKNPEQYALLPPNQIEKWVMNGLQFRARRDVGPLAFDISAQKVIDTPLDRVSGHQEDWYNVKGYSHWPTREAYGHECDFMFSIGPLFMVSPDFRHGVMDDVWLQVRNFKYSNSPMRKKLSEMRPRDYWQYAQEHGYHRYDRKPEHKAIIEREEEKASLTGVRVTSYNNLKVR